MLKNFTDAKVVKNNISPNNFHKKYQFQCLQCVFFSIFCIIFIKYTTFAVEIKIFMMKKLFVVVCGIIFSISSLYAGEVMEKLADGTYVVRTETLCTAKGYKSPTPLEVYINKKGVIIKVVALPNRETPKYFKLIKDKYIPLFEGKKLKNYSSVDAVTGATLSCNAVRENVKAALEYFKAHK